MSLAALMEGADAPGFEVQSAQGPVRLTDYAGRPVVIYFYPKDDTAGCTRQAVDFSELASEFAKTGVAVLGVSRDTVASHEKFIGKHRLSVKLGSDPGGDMVEAYGVWVDKSMYGRVYKGIERTTVLIDGAGIIRKIWRKVRVAGHAAEVLEAARELQSQPRD